MQLTKGLQRKFTVFSFLLHSIRPFKIYVGLHLLVITFNAIDVSLWPYLTKILINKLTSSADKALPTEIWPIASLLIFLTFLPGFIWRVADFSWMKMTPLLKKKITCESIEYLAYHSHNFFQNNFSGALANKVRDLANQTPRLLDIILYQFFSVSLCLVIAVFAVFFINPIFSLAMILWAIIFVLMATKAAKITNKIAIEIANQASKITGNLVDALGNISNVKLFASHTYEQKRLNKICDEYTQLFCKRGWFLLKFFTWHGLTFSSYFAFCIVALIWLYGQKLVTIGDFAMLFAINSWMIHQMWTAANELRVFLEDVGTIKQALEIINEPWEVKDKPNAQPLLVSAGEIAFEKVKFSYRDSPPIFSDKSLVINSGQKVGLVGHSGGGKTSFVNLILRLFDVQEGRILIDGQDISKVTQNSLRATIGMIPQDPTLFHRSIAENIAIGRINSSHSEIIEAAKKANAHEFIEKLPFGYDSLVGERGVKLSGGQRQRIAIARAFLKNAPILILDEATSQLDSIAENFIQESLKNLMIGKTTIVIAHRLSTLKMMDRILVFDSGKIVEDGPHQKLLGLDGAYKELWEAQIGGFL